MARFRGFRARLRCSILKHRERTVVPGGGANAIMNLADLKVNVLPVGIVGDDEPGDLLLQALRAKKVSLSGSRTVSKVTRRRLRRGFWRERRTLHGSRWCASIVNRSRSTRPIRRF